MAIRLTKIYTRKGDGGTTALVGGERVSKTSLRLEVYGTVDELNSFAGLVRTESLALNPGDRAVRAETEKTFRWIQNKLFDAGSILATPHGKTFPKMREISGKDVAFLENRMDAYQKSLRPLDSFTLPGGGKLNAHAHVARTVCRRLERLLWRLHASEPLPPALLKFVNRLSDYFFVYSRWTAKALKEKEYLWE